MSIAKEPADVSPSPPPVPPYNAEQQSSMSSLLKSKDEFFSAIAKKVPLSENLAVPSLPLKEKLWSSTDTLPINAALDEVSSIITRELPPYEDTAVPPFPLKRKIWSSTDTLPTHAASSTDDQALPEVPPKLPERKLPRKPISTKRKPGNNNEVKPSIPPRPSKNIK